MNRNAADVEVHFSKTYKEFDSFYNEKKGVISKFIDNLFRKSMKMRFEKVIESIAPYENKTVLDVGCGAGRYSLALALKGIKKSLGLDFAENMIAEAQRRAGQFNVQYICNFEKADFIKREISETFDHSFAMGVLDYIENPVQFVQKMIRYTTQSVMISFPSSGGIVQWGRKQYFYKIKKCPVYFYTKEEVERIARKAGAESFTLHSFAKDFFLNINIKGEKG